MSRSIDAWLVRWSSTVLVPLLLVVACGGSPPAGGWVGHSESSLYEQFGTPIRTQPLSGGAKVVTFERRNVLTGQLLCEFIFIIGSNKTVTSENSRCPGRTVG